MTLLKFVDAEWGPVGSFNWFETHGTAMGRTNSLISCDNKGTAAQLMEDWYEHNSVDPPFAETQMHGFDFYTSPWRQLYRRVSNLIPHADD